MILSNRFKGSQSKKCIKFKIKEEMRKSKENKRHYAKILFSQFSIMLILLYLNLCIGQINFIKIDIFAHSDFENSLM